MKRLLIALCGFLCASCFAQNADDPASRDDVILLLRTMHSHDLMLKMMTAQTSGMRELLEDQVKKDKGALPADFDRRYTKVMDGLIKGMPVDEITQAMIPAYQAHFTHGDIEAMNTFYSSPVGQKVLDELPQVMQEGLKEAIPILSKYLSEWKERSQKELESETPKGQPSPPARN